MSTITTTDGTQIDDKDWGSGQPVVCSHGWPLRADAWEDQMVCLVTRGYRCIAHDRRGHGRSNQPWHGNDRDTYADDLATPVAQFDLTNAIHVGHSTGGVSAAPTPRRPRRLGAGEAPVRAGRDDGVSRSGERADRAGETRPGRTSQSRHSLYRRGPDRH